MRSKIRRVPAGRWIAIVTMAALVCLAATPARAAQEGSETFLGLPTLVWKIINFVAFFGLLTYFLARPLTQFFASRREAIARQASEAAQARQQAVELRAEMEKRVAALSGEIAALRERLHREGEREREALTRQGETETARLLTQVDQEANRRVEHARRELATEVATAAAELARELLQRELSAEDRERIFAASVGQLGSEPAGERR